MIYKSTGFINFAQGSLALLGVYLAYVFSVEQGLPVAVAVVCAMAASSVVAMFVERVFIRPFPPDHVLPLVIVTLGLLLIIDSAVGIVWGFRTRSLPSMFPSGAPIEWGIAQLTLAHHRQPGHGVRGGGAFVSAVVAHQDRLGLPGGSSNLESARLVGIRVGPTLGFGWALAAAIGTLGGSLVVPDLLLEPSVMLRVLIFSLAAAALGGLDSMLGAVLGGLVVGLARNLLVTFLDLSELALATAVAVILVVLLVRPTGLFGIDSGGTGMRAAVPAGSRQHRRRQIIGWVLFALVVVLVPFLIADTYSPTIFGNRYTVGMGNLSQAVALMVAILGLNIATGNSGQLSLGHSFFVGSGAYLTAVLVNDFHWSYLSTLGVVVPGLFLFGVLFGIPALRIRAVSGAA